MVEGGKRWKQQMKAAAKHWRVEWLEVLVYIYMVVDLKVLVSSVYDDDPEHIKISFGESIFSSWRK